MKLFVFFQIQPYGVVSAILPIFDLDFTIAMPFSGALDALNKVGWHYVIKIQTKQFYHPTDEPAWFDN
jgi:hypothetical protein